MAVARQYVMQSSSDGKAAIETALSELAKAVRALPGCEGVEILHDLDDEHRYLLIERWASEDAYRMAGSQLPKHLLRALITELEGPPAASRLGYLEIV